MNERGFYIFLPSNASPSEFPNNKTNHFRVRFDKPISLPNYTQWEMALIELSYVHSLQTIRGDETLEFVATKDELYDEREIPQDMLDKFTLPGINYTFGDYAGENASYWFRPPNTMTNSSNKARVCFYLYRSGSRAELSNRFASFIGMKQLTPGRSLPNDYKKPTKPPMERPSRKAGQNAVEFNLELERYTALDKIYEDNSRLFDQYQREELKEPPFVFYHHERDMNVAGVDSETWSQYDFASVPFKSLLPYPRINVYRPAAGYTVMKRFKLRQGHYPTATSLLKELKRVLGDQEANAEWTYYESNNRFSVKVSSKFHLRIHPRIASLLGYKVKDENTYLELKAGGTYEAEQTPDLLRGIYHMYVYTDMTELAIVGHQQAALLRAIPLQDDAYGKVKSFSFNNPIYEKVSRSEIETAEIMLCDDAGELLPLGQGKTFLVLHFRPSQL